jgi:3-methyladenine DNA glycosylase AlkD
MTAGLVKTELARYASPEDAVGLARFFRTGPGEYGEGDVFIGVRVPDVRRVARAFSGLALPQIEALLESSIHEERLVALHIATLAFEKATPTGQRQLYQLYLRALARGLINNWDLVDTSAAPIVGDYLRERPLDPLFKLAAKRDLWSRRVAIVSTMRFLQVGNTWPTIALAEQLLHDPHDLMHKAVGWLLREVGKRVDRELLRAFLRAHAHEMPRTMLRYSIEHFPEKERAQYLGAKAKRARQ